METETRDGPPRALFIAAIVVAVGSIVAVLIVAALRQHPAEPTPVAVASAPAPEADSAQCRTLLSALPEQLGDYRRAALAEPAPAGAAAWQGEVGREAVILRCGLDRPADFVVGAPLQVVDEVQWFEVKDSGRSTWFTVDRAVYVALTLPQGSGPTPIQDVSAAVAKSLPAKPIEPGPAR